MAFSKYGQEIIDKRTKVYSIPPFTTRIDKLESLAEKVLSPEAFGFAAGASSTHKTLQANLDIFNEYRIIPRMLRSQTNALDLKRKIFGRWLPAPITMAPIGLHKLIDQSEGKGEESTAKVFGELGLPFILSTVASTSLQDIAQANGKENPRWFQLYMTKDVKFMASMIETAKREDYEALVVTVDTWEAGWKPRDLDNGFSPYPASTGSAIAKNDAYVQSVLGFDTSSPTLTESQKREVANYHLDQIVSDQSPTWDKLAHVRSLWGSGPMIVKGIQHRDDAIAAVENGMDGIIVSNHGGRQVDGAIPSLQALQQIVDAVQGKITIGFDSGIRCGSDIFKAIAVGADFVSIGRPVLWGLALAGKEGVRHVMRTLLADFEMQLRMAGCNGIDDVTRECLANKKGDYFAPKSQL
ncbi:FMN-dependent alpha-hydroxy acid dehydrogenase [Xylona heveae TC161]|uniref:FMN-dependent alpha-hydroxy acid dehydrogenase n=1 Tax=Xylona heveae (strain CBS 132557 / TC161) TaxID=1328760 RepID=A0A165FNS1_XYLHT|nr:FMN-dependent alpha-hydroxy acid dehydrogenase [Xylona heveae TC161]KZF21199.1 FMN-dependent alpha-hydroxy acid dehydrogenase [Xylona heveae TC161]